MHSALPPACAWLALAASVVPDFAAAQDVYASGPAIHEVQDEAADADKAPITAKELVEAGGTAPLLGTRPDTYPPALEELHARGIQGAPTLSFTINHDGSVADLSFTEPSPSAELNQVAIDYVSQFKFEPGRNSDGEPIKVAMTSPIPLEKDQSAEDIGTKTCGDFVIDADWFLGAHSGKTIKDMNIWKATVGLFFVMNAGGSLNDKLWAAGHPQ